MRFSNNLSLTWTNWVDWRIRRRLIRQRVTRARPNSQIVRVTKRTTKIFYTRVSVYATKTTKKTRSPRTTRTTTTRTRTTTVTASPSRRSRGRRAPPSPTISSTVWRRASRGKSIWACRTAWSSRPASIWATPKSKRGTRIAAPNGSGRRRSASSSSPKRAISRPCNACYSRIPTGIIRIRTPCPPMRRCVCSELCPTIRGLRPAHLANKRRPHRLLLVAVHRQRICLRWTLLSLMRRLVIRFWRRHPPLRPVITWPRMAPLTSKPVWLALTRLAHFRRRPRLPRLRLLLRPRLRSQNHRRARILPPLIILLLLAQIAR